jgi:hypothetical protein
MRAVTRHSPWLAVIGTGLALGLVSCAGASPSDPSRADGSVADDTGPGAADDAGTGADESPEEALPPAPDLHPDTSADSAVDDLCNGLCAIAEQVPCPDRQPRADCVGSCFAVLRLACSEQAETMLRCRTTLKPSDWYCDGQRTQKHPGKCDTETQAWLTCFRGKP